MLLSPQQQYCNIPRSALASLGILDLSWKWKGSI